MKMLFYPRFQIELFDAILGHLSLFDSSFIHRRNRFEIFPQMEGTAYRRQLHRVEATDVLYRFSLELNCGCLLVELLIRDEK